jgi:hypothetical protein
VTRLATKRCRHNLKASRLKGLFALTPSSLDDVKGSNQHTGLIVEGVPSGFDASDRGHHRAMKELGFEKRPSTSL